jgi:hypothetical protein
MKKPDERLFNYRGADNKGNDYHFKNLLGEKCVHYLGTTEKLWKKCPICGNYTIAGYDQIDSWCRCPSCNMNTLGMTLEEYKQMVEGAKVNAENNAEKFRQKALRYEKMIGVINTKLIKNNIKLIKTQKKK